MMRRTTPATLAAALAATLALGSAAAGLASPAPRAAIGAQEEADGSAGQIEPDPVFDRVPGELPRAEVGRWQDWSGSDVPSEELRPLVEDSVRAYMGRDFPGALRSLYELLELEPDYPPALYQLGTVYFRLRRYGDAQLALERFLEVAPGELDKTQALAHCYYSLGDYEQAVAHYEQVLAAGAESLEARRGLALALMRLGEFERALDEFDTVVSADPTHGDAWAWKARVLYDLDRSEEALEPARKGVEHLAFEPRPWFILSQVLYELGQDEQADEAYARFEELTRLVQIARHYDGQLLYDASNLDAYVKLVGVHREIGDLASVRMTFARAFELFPRECRLRFWSLEVLLDMGDKEGARVSAKAIEGACGEDPETWRQLELFYGRIKDSKEQLRCGERYLRLGR